MLGRTVGELLESVSYPELKEWVEFAAIEPDPEWRADVRAAQICAILANVNRDSKKHPEAYQIKQFMLFEAAARAKEEEAVPDSTIEVEPTIRALPKPDGAKIAPETVSWLFAMSRKGKK